MGVPGFGLRGNLALQHQGRQQCQKQHRYQPGYIVDRQYVHALIISQEITVFFGN
jgi:hypothetical protein